MSDYNDRWFEVDNAENQNDDDDSNNDNVDDVTSDVQLARLREFQLRIGHTIRTGAINIDYDISISEILRGIDDSEVSSGADDASDLSDSTDDNDADNAAGNVDDSNNNRNNNDDINTNNVDDVRAVDLVDVATGSNVKEIHNIEETSGANDVTNTTDANDTNNNDNADDKIDNGIKDATTAVTPAATAAASDDKSFDNGTEKAVAVAAATTAGAVAATAAANDDNNGNTQEESSATKVTDAEQIGVVAFDRRIPLVRLPFHMFDHIPVVDSGPFSPLPNAVVLRIVQYLNIIDRGALALVNHNFAFFVIGDRRLLLPPPEIAAIPGVVRHCFLRRLQAGWNRSESRLCNRCYKFVSVNAQIWQIEQETTLQTELNLRDVLLRQRRCCPCATTPLRMSGSDIRKDMQDWVDGTSARCPDCGPAFFKRIHEIFNILDQRRHFPDCTCGWRHIVNSDRW